MEAQHGYTDFYADGGWEYLSGEYGHHTTMPVAGYKGIFSCWLKRRTLATGNIMSLNNAATTVRCLMQLNNMFDNRYFIYLRDSSHNNIVTTAPFTSILLERRLEDTVLFHHLLVSWDTQNSLFKAVVDGIIQTPILTWHNNNKVAYDTAVNFDVFHSDSFSNIDADITALYFNATEYVDVSDPIQYRKWRTSDGLPVVHGASNGSQFTGTQPTVWLPNGDAENNAGSGPNFTKTGTPIATTGAGMYMA